MNFYYFCAFSTYSNLKGGSQILDLSLMWPIESIELPTPALGSKGYEIVSPIDTLGGVFFIVSRDIFINILEFWILGSAIVSDSKLLDIHILDYSISFSSSTRVLKIRKINYIKYASWVSIFTFLAIEWLLYLLQDLLLDNH